MVCTLAASLRVGPKAACSRKRRAAAGDTCGFATPISTTKGLDTAETLATVILPDPDMPENPVAVRVPLENVVPSGVPFSDATDDAMKPVPVIAVEKIPSGNCPLEPTAVITGVGGISVTVAVPFPFGPVAVTVSVPVVGNDAGAVYRPAVVTVPCAAVQAVAPADVNCSVAPRFTETVAGEITCGFSSVTVADADPPGPVAETVAVPEEGMLAGAV
jgi:hypothetical protein